VTAKHVIVNSKIKALNQIRLQI